MSQPNVYEYQDPRQFLSDVLEAKQQRNAGFSLRAWSRQLGYANPSLLSEILRGKRKIRHELSARLKSNLQLSDAEKRYFDLLVLYDNAGSREEKEALAGVLASLRPDATFSTIELDTFAVIADWYHLAILELVQLPDFREDASWITERLGNEVPPRDITRALERLIRLQLLVRDGKGRLQRNKEGIIGIGTALPSDAIKTFHAQMLDKAKQALLQQPLEVREIVGITLPANPAKLPAAKKLIQQFLVELTDVLKDEACEEVLQINLQLFPLTSNRYSGNVGEAKTATPASQSPKEQPKSA